MRELLLLTLAIWRIRRNLGPPSGLAVDDQCLLRELTSRGVTWYGGDEWSGDETALQRFAEGEVIAVRAAPRPDSTTPRAADGNSPECAAGGSGARVGPS